MRPIFRAIILLFASTIAAHAQDASTALVDVAKTIRGTNCTTNCKAGEWLYASVSLPADIIVGGRKTFIVNHPVGCGSGGCMSTILAIGPDDVHLLGKGFDRAANSSQEFSLPQSPYIQSVSAGTLISGQSTTSGTQISDSRIQGDTFNDRFPATKAEVDLVFSGQPLIRDAITEVADQFIQAMLSPGFQNLLPKQFAISPDDILNQIFVNPDQFTTHVSGGLKGFGQNIAYEAARGAMITILSEYLAEAFVAEGGPLGFLDPGLKVYVEAMLSAGLEESFFAVTAGSAQKAVAEGVFRRAWDLVDIAIATKGILKSQDHAILATVAGIESAVDIELGRPTPEGEALADRVYQDLVDRAALIYGTDDEAAIRKIFNLTKVALINQKSGHPDKARLLRDRILEVGFQSSNIHPFSLITKPKDWVVAALSLGKDAPERVAQIAIQGTSLGQVEQPDPLPSCISIGRDLTTPEIIKNFGNKIMTVGYAIPDVVPSKYKIGPLERPNEFVTYLPILNNTTGGVVVPHKVRVANDKLCEENKYGEFCSMVTICDSDDALYVLDPSSQSPGYVIGLDADGSASGEAPIQTDGALCRTARAHLTTSALKQYFWGSKISGINAKGTVWQEYLARGGDVSNTIFVNSKGKETIGSYKFADDKICFGYGTFKAWTCKTISACVSGEAPYVIANRGGKQTSLITEVEPYGFAPYHERRWDALAREQAHTVPFDTKSRKFTALPTSMSSVATDLVRALSRANQTAQVDRASCTLTVVEKTPIMKQVLSAGGWSDWMGSTTNGQKNVGQTTRIWSIELEKYDPSTSQHGLSTGIVSVNPLPGENFSLQTIIRRTDDPSANSDQTQAIGGIGLPGLPVSRVDTLLGELSDVCSGRSSPPISQASSQSGNSDISNSSGYASSSSQAHNCSSTENDIARLQCFDNAFPRSATSAQFDVPAPERDDGQTSKTIIANAIVANKEITERRSTIGFLPGAFDEAVAHGLVAPMVQHAQRGITNHGNPWQAAVSPAGKDRGITTSTPRSFTLMSPTSITVEVTGFTDISSGQDSMQASFDWFYSDPPTVLKLYAQTGGNGTATLRLWDDGWRVENISVAGNKIPFYRDNSLSAQIDKDLARVLREGGPWVFAEREQIFVPAASLR